MTSLRLASFMPLIALSLISPAVAQAPPAIPPWPAAATQPGPSAEELHAAHDGSGSN